MIRLLLQDLSRRAAGFALAILLLGLGVAWWATASEIGPTIPQGRGENCVADTDFMRRNHMDLLVHQRDETVLEGIRDKPFSLTECVDCHVQTASNGEPHRIDAEGQFCQSCHTFAAVKIDCFGCHAAVPDSAESTAFAPVKTFTFSTAHLKELNEYINTVEHDADQTENN